MNRMWNVRSHGHVRTVRKGPSAELGKKEKSHGKGKKSDEFGADTEVRWMTLTMITE